MISHTNDLFAYPWYVIDKWQDRGFWTKEPVQIVVWPRLKSVRESFE